MKQKRPLIKNGKSFIIYLFLMVVFSPVAAANILEGPHVLHLCITKMGEATSLTVGHKIKVYDDKYKDGFFVFHEKAMYLFPDHFRAEAIIRDKQQIYIADLQSALKIFDNRIETEYESGFDHYKDILLFKSRMMLEQRLKALGVDVSVTNFNRYFGGIAYVLGKQPQYGENYPQLWIDKESFLPVRWLLRRSDKSGGKTELEIRYTNWRQKGELWYPYHIEFFSGGTLVREIIVTKTNTTIIPDAGLFNIEAIKKQLTDRQQKSDSASGKGDTDGQMKNLDDIIEKDQLAF